MHINTKILISAGVNVFLIIACYKAENHSNSQDKMPNTTTVSHLDISNTKKGNVINSNSLFNKEVGKMVKGDTGKLWIANYNKGKSDCTIRPYTLKSDYLKNLLSLDSCVGIIFYNAKNGSAWEILPFAISSPGNLIKTDSVATENGYISWQVAKQRINNYQTAYPGSVEAHFFGRIILNNLTDSLKNIRFIMAWNNSGEQLLLNDAAQTDPGGGGDADNSIHCPPICPVN